MTEFINIILEILAVIPQDKIISFLLESDILAYLFIGLVVYKAASLLGVSVKFFKGRPFLIGILLYFAVMFGGIYVYYPSVL